MRRMMLILLFTITTSYAPLSAQTGGIAPSSASDDQSQVTAEDIVNRYLEAIGGLGAVKRIQSKRIVYRTHIFPREPYAQERIWTRPDIMQSGPPGEPATMVTEGAKSWFIGPEGRNEMPAGVAASQHKRADIDGPLVDAPEKGITLTYAGKDVYDRTELHHVTVTFPDSVRWEYYFDARSGLLRKTAEPTFFMLNDKISPGPDVNTYYYDYRRVGSIKVPHHWIQASEDHTHLFVIEDIQIEE